MPFEPFAHAARTAAIFGGVADLLPPRMVPGLPAVGASPLAVRHPQIGSTMTDISGNVDPLAPIPVASLSTVDIRQRSGGGVSLFMRLHTNYAATMNMQGLHALAQRMVTQLRNMSRGPLTRRLLAQMHHPYGRDKGGIGRRVPGFGRRVAGVRGSVPNLTVINYQTGRLERSWGYSIAPEPQGATVELFNTAPEAWYVTSGTIKMQAHSPLTYVATMFRPELLTEWRREATQAYHRQAAMAATRQSLASLSEAAGTVL